MRRQFVCILATLIAVPLASLYMTLHWFPPTSLPYNAVRYTASFLGFGWCEPSPVPKTTYHFSGAEGPALTWENDALFWRNFPCARESYRVWLPEPPSSSSNIAALPRTCRSLTVTAFFDIGRAKWLPPFDRSVEQYLSNAKTVVATLNPMVIFTSPELAEGIIADRRAAGLMDRTLVVGMSLQCTPEAWTEAGARELMCRPEEWTGNIYLGTPERQHPWYNVVMWMKASFVTAAASLPQPELDAEWVTWLDLGCHGPMCSDALKGKCIDPAPWAPLDRIRIAQVEPINDDLAAYTPREFVRGHRVTFAGTIFGIGRKHAAEAMSFFRDTAAYLVARGVADTDQTVFHFAFIRKPEAFAAYHVYFQKWGRIVTEYIAGSVGQL